MSRKIGLNGYLQIVKGAGIKFKIKQLRWQIRYAWRRAWFGYDDVDIFDLGYSFAYKMPVLLKEFKKHNIALFYDEETNKQLDEKETDQVLDEMIFYFENCDENVVYDRVLGVDWVDKFNREDMIKADTELSRCREEALRLFSKWCWRLWY